MRKTFQKTMKKRGDALLMTAAVLAGLLAGCGSEEQTKSGSTAENEYGTDMTGKSQAPGRNTGTIIKKNMRRNTRKRLRSLRKRLWTATRQCNP